MFFSLQGNSPRLAMRDGVFFGWGGVEPWRNGSNWKGRNPPSRNMQISWDRKIYKQLRRVQVSSKYRGALGHSMDMKTLGDLKSLPCWRNPSRTGYITKSFGWLKDSLQETLVFTSENKELLSKYHSPVLGNAVAGTNDCWGSEKQQQLDGQLEKGGVKRPMTQRKRMIWLVSTRRMNWWTGMLYLLLSLWFLQIYNNTFPRFPGIFLDDSDRLIRMCSSGLEVDQHLRTVSGRVIGRNIENLLVVMSTLD